jgi:hypothetical protein
VQTDSVLNTCKTCRHASTVQLQYGYSTTSALWTTHLAPLQCQVTRQHDATLLTKYSMTGDKIRCAHIVEDIICYSYLLVPYCIWFYLPRGHLSDLGSHCNYPTLSYKRPGQAPVLEKKEALSTPTLKEPTQCLNNTLQYDSYSPIDVGYYAPTIRTT